MAFAPGGLEEVDLGEHVEYVLYGAPGELPEIGDVTAVAGAALVEVSTSEVRTIDWHIFHVPIDVGPAAACGRPWARRPATGALDVVIEPGQAFGTGSHATTRLTWSCWSSSPRRARSRTGAAAAACSRSRPRSSAGRPVLACDIEPESVAATREGAEVNGVAVEVSRCDVRRAARPRRPCSRTSSARCCCRWPST